MYEICLFDGSKLPFKLNHYLSKLRKLCNIIHLTRLSQVYQKMPLIGQGVSPSALIMLVSSGVKPGQPRNARTKWRCLIPHRVPTKMLQSGVPRHVRLPSSFVRGERFNGVYGHPIGSHRSLPVTDKPWQNFGGIYCSYTVNNG